MKNLTFKPQLFIGLMSGTSVDGIDVALVEISDGQCQLLASECYPIEQSLKTDIHSLCTPQVNQQNAMAPDYQTEIQINRIEQMAKLDHQLGLVFANVVNLFIKDKNLSKKSIIAIGSHGQTIRHRPNQETPFTLQLGDANLIAQHTGITAVSDFRRMDMAAGGQGAPLVPAFHQSVMSSQHETRVILNLGGIANITLLPKVSHHSSEAKVIGFDTGPANTLLDAHYKRHHNKSNFDKDGEFAKQGKVDQRFLSRLLSDPYFKRLAPKSTGREYFSVYWFQRELDQLDYPIEPESVQATLMALTTQTVADSIKGLGLVDYQVYACGGGMHNQYLLNQLSEKLGKTVLTTNHLGVDGDSLEAMTFAWLAHRRVEGLTGNLPSVTGAKEAKVLGALYHP
jgi:anhydro-N-acetylmuramic acid kinase